MLDVQSDGEGFGFSDVGAGLLASEVALRCDTGQLGWAADEHALALRGLLQAGYRIRWAERS